MTQAEHGRGGGPLRRLVHAAPLARGWRPHTGSPLQSETSLRGADIGLKPLHI